MFAVLFISNIIQNKSNFALYLRELSFFTQKEGCLFVRGGQSFLCGHLIKAGPKYYNRVGEGPEFFSWVQERARFFVP